MSRWRRLRRLALPTLAVLYMALLAYPDVLFAHQVSVGTFVVHSDRPIDPAIRRVIDDARARLARSPIGDPKARHHVYLCNDAARFRLFSPRSGGAFGVTYGLFGTSFLNRCDIPSDRVFRPADRNRERPLGCVIAHERMHVLMARHYGVLRDFLLPDWKKEGYCDAVAGGPSFDTVEGKRLIRSGVEDDSGSFRYFKAGLMVRYLLEVEGLSADQIMARHVDEAGLMGRVRDAIDRL